MPRWLTPIALLVATLFVGMPAAAQNNADEPLLCIDTLDCGGLCGTEQEIQVFLAQCNAGPTGPCFSSCWNSCRHANSQNNNPNATLCTLECLIAECPNDNATQGLQQAGLIEECPLPDPAAVCFQIYAPVECGGCTYGNSCIAAAAGFNPATCSSADDPIITLSE